MLTTMLKPTDGEALVWWHNVVTTQKRRLHQATGPVHSRSSK
jgi:uncharacterized cysteine cluster protein YcgN (CxxCxxCC family)